MRLKTTARNRTACDPTSQDKNSVRIRRYSIATQREASGGSGPAAAENDENSRARLQNVHEDSCAGHLRAADAFAKATGTKDKELSLERSSSNPPAWVEGWRNL